MPRPRTQTYLLRLWREHPGAPVRTTLVYVARPEEQRHFADLEALCAFLRAQAGATTDGSYDLGADHCTPPEPC